MTTTTDAPKVLPASVLRVLLAVLWLADAGCPVTLRGINRRIGWSDAPNYTRECLRRLRVAGLVTWETDGKGEAVKATIRPTCRLELWT
jgi:hypothetical protein